jgi:hypothetical protein
MSEYLYPLNNIMINLAMGNNKVKIVKTLIMYGILNIHEHNASIHAEFSTEKTLQVLLKIIFSSQTGYIVSKSYTNIKITKNSTAYLLLSKSYTSSL